jgi:sec-independent protein translocase protein TatB
MLPGLGFSEILLLGVIALLVVGPKDLPVMLRELGKWTRKLQGMAAEFRSGFDELARQAELDELRKEVESMRQSAMIPDVETVLTAPPDTPGLTPTAPEGDTPPPSSDGGAAAEIPVADAAPTEAISEIPASPAPAEAAR